ncbi:hypothetical protein STEG23_025470 [Scotinomys teguina]
MSTALTTERNIPPTHLTNTFESGFVTTDQVPISDPHNPFTSDVTVFTSGFLTLASGTTAPTPVTSSSFTDTSGTITEPRKSTKFQPVTVSPSNSRPFSTDPVTTSTMSRHLSSGLSTTGMCHQLTPNRSQETSLPAMAVVLTLLLVPVVLVMGYGFGRRGTWEQMDRQSGIRTCSSPYMTLTKPLTLSGPQFPLSLMKGDMIPAPIPTHRSTLFVSSTPTSMEHEVGCLLPQLMDWVYPRDSSGLPTLSITPTTSSTKLPVLITTKHLPRGKTVTQTFPKSTVAVSSSDPGVTFTNVTTVTSSGPQSWAKCVQISSADITPGARECNAGRGQKRASDPPEFPLQSVSFLEIPAEFQQFTKGRQKVFGAFALSTFRSSNVKMICFIESSYPQQLLVYGIIDR